MTDSGDEGRTGAERLPGTGEHSANLLRNLPAALPAELLNVLVENPQVRIERIVSTGQKSPDGFWYDQAEVEWVLLLRGSAALRIEGVEQPVTLEAGDHLLIPAHQRHRVEWTCAREPTVWLAVFWAPPDPGAATDHPTAQ